MPAWRKGQGATENLLADRTLERVVADSGTTDALFATCDRHSDEDFATSTRRVKEARARLLKKKRAADAYATLSDEVTQSLEAKAVTLAESTDSPSPAS